MLYPVQSPIRCRASDAPRLITLADARQIIAAAEKRAQEIKQPQNIAVVDSGGNLVANIRMELFLFKGRLSGCARKFVGGHAARGWTGFPACEG